MHMIKCCINKFLMYAAMGFLFIAAWAYYFARKFCKKAMRRVADYNIQDENLREYLYEIIQRAIPE